MVLMNVDEPLGPSDKSYANRGTAFIGTYSPTLYDMIYYVYNYNYN